MGINELAIRKPAKLTIVDQSNGLFNEIPNVTYALIDSTHYSFEYRINDDVNVNMFESDRTYDSDDFIDADFDNSISERDFSYYTVAVASGVPISLITP